MVVVDDADPPIVVFETVDQLPAGLTAGSAATWFANCVVEAIEQTQPQGVAVRVSDGDVQAERAHAEGAVLAAADQRGLPTILLIRQRMLKPLLGTGRPEKGAWAAFPKTDPFVSGLKTKVREAAMASLAAARS